MSPWGDDRKEETSSPTKSGDDVLAEARKRHAEGKELTGEHVRALEHPDEFAGQDVLVSDAEREAAEA